ncbi:MAG: hypothetical protein U1F43_31350 [Myxococcota bacterium]
MALDRDLTPLPGALPPPPTAATNRRLPVDGGMAALGVVTLAAAAFGVVVGISIFVAGRTFGGPAGALVPAFAVFVAGLVRSGYHVAAGRAATKRLPILGAAVTRYLVVSAIHTLVVLVVAIFAWFDGGFVLPLLLGLGALLMSWPVALWLLAHRRSLKRIFETADTFDLGLVPGDRSVGAAGVLMVVFGSLFLVVDLGVAGYLIVAGVPISTSTIMWFVTLGLFTLRSSLHVGWGLAALRGKMDFPTFKRASQAYLWLAFLTVLVALGAMFAMDEFRMALRKAPMNVMFIAVVVSMALMAWPAVLNAFVQDTVPFWDDGDAERPFRPAVDRGLTALGYLHVWLAVFGAAQWVASIVGLSQLGLMPSIGAPGGPLHALVSLAVIGVQLWVGLELVGRPARYRRAALVYAAAATLAVVLTLTVFKVSVEPGAIEDEPGGMETLLEVVSTAIALVLPLLTLGLSRARPLAEA